MSKEKERLNPGFSIPTAMKTVSPNTKPLITPEIKKRIEFGAEIMKKHRARYLDEHRIEASWTDVDVALEEGAKLPEYAHPEDAGADIRCIKGTVIKAGESAVFKTGVHIRVPHGCVGLLFSKSGLNVVNGLTSRGVVDEGFTGQLIVRVYNHSNEDYEFKDGDKITQIVLLPVIHGVFHQVDAIKEKENGRNNSGYGSSGR